LWERSSRTAFWHVPSHKYPWLWLMENGSTNNLQSNHRYQNVENLSPGI
jgi:hypothetical protein